MFAWAGTQRAPAVGEAMRAAFARTGLAADDWIVELQSAGAHLLG
jgi:hypothetical protein